MIRNALSTHKHLPALDGLRALAILLVVPHNIDLLSEKPVPWLRAPWILIHDGWIGVTLFFVLSGFLITGNLLDSRQATNYFSSFYARRAARILPLYYGILLLCFVVLPALKSAPVELLATSRHQIWLWLFVSNWTAPHRLAVEGFAHFWSLAVEEQFYLIWPLIVYGSSSRQIVRLSIWLILAALVLRLALLGNGISHETVYMNTFTRMDALAAGAAVAAALRLPGLRAAVERGATTLVLGGLVLLSAAFLFSRGFSNEDFVTQTAGYSSLSLGFGAFVMAAATERGLPRIVLRLLKSRPLRLVARYSYGMYVFHPLLHLYVLLPLFRALIASPSTLEQIAYMAVTLGLTFVLAAISYEFFERRFLNLTPGFAPRVAS